MCVCVCVCVCVCTYTNIYAHTRAYTNQTHIDTHKQYICLMLCMCKHN